MRCCHGMTRHTAQAGWCKAYGKARGEGPSAKSASGSRPTRPVPSSSSSSSSASVGSGPAPGACTPQLTQSSSLGSRGVAEGTCLSRRPSAVGVQLLIFRQRRRNMTSTSQ